MIITTSWDDGYALDLRVAELLEAHGMTGTFYVCGQPQHGQAMLTEEQIRGLAARHEVGAHGMTHPKLTTIPPEHARREIEESKKWVERVTGKPCETFCYPYGDWDAEVRQMTKDAGYLGARTTADLETRANDRFALPTSIQVMPFPRRQVFSRWWHAADPFGPLRARWPRLRRHGIALRECRDWPTVAKALFVRMRERGGSFFHLWGHSREIEKYGLWGQLEDVLRFVAAQPGVRHMTNADLIRTTLAHADRPAQ